LIQNVNSRKSGFSHWTTRYGELSALETSNNASLARRGKGTRCGERWSSSLARRDSLLARASGEYQHGQNAKFCQNSPNLMVLTLKLILIIILWII